MTNKSQKKPLYDITKEKKNHNNNKTNNSPPQKNPKTTKKTPPNPTPHPKETPAKTPKFQQYDLVQLFLVPVDDTLIFFFPATNPSHPFHFRCSSK